MAARRGPGLPSDPRNPFANPPTPQPRRDYDSESEAGDAYERRGTYQSYNSTTHLTSGMYQSSQYDLGGTYSYGIGSVLRLRFFSREE